MPQIEVLVTLPYGVKSERVRRAALDHMAGTDHGFPPLTKLDLWFRLLPSLYLETRIRGVNAEVYRTQVENLRRVIEDACSRSVRKGE